MKRILILGGSGFIGHALYKELSPYFNTYATYYSNKRFEKNQQYFHFNFTQEKPQNLLKKINPHLIISAVRGPFVDHIILHQALIEHIQLFNCRLLFLSSSNVFDAFHHYPSYEFDKTLSESIYGRLKIKIENALLRLPPSQYVIARLPMIYGVNSPRIKEMEEVKAAGKSFEVFPNTIINVNSVRKLCQQLHYIINQQLTGIYHLGSIDLITHYDFHKRLAKKRGWNDLVFKQVYTTNEMRYIAVLPKENKLPSHLQTSCDEVLKDSITALTD